jgi:glycosyltransferase involved in cell wall biosynthesis
MAKLSAVMIVKNESHNIGRCLDALDWADEIVILDTGSTDNTKEICRARGCRVYEQQKWEGFGKAKQEVVDLAAFDWILSIDADEVLSPALINEIKYLKDLEFFGDAWRLKSQGYYMEKQIKYCGWNNVTHIRIFNKKQSRFKDNPVHEGIVTTQHVRQCVNYYEHFTYRSREEHFSKMRFYGDLGAKSLREKGKTCGRAEAVIRAILKFLKMFIFRLGFLDGYTGLRLCLDSAWGIWYKYNRLRMLYK